MFKSPYSHPAWQQTAGNCTLDTLLDGYESLSVAQLLQPLSSTFTHRVLPESLGMPVRDKAAFAQHAAGIFSVFESFRMDAVEMLKAADTPQETWTVRALMMGELKGGKGEWRNECVMIVKMSADGSQVEEITEFVDSAKAMEMRQQHAPKGFDSVDGQQPGEKAMWEQEEAFGITLCWFAVCVVTAKLGAPVLALVIFWVHPKLEAVRKSLVAQLGDADSNRMNMETRSNEDAE
jgi:hypothetical protein